ncbi:MAG: hypothetical protein ACPL7D_11555 [Candidatus Sumerlaeaceae bacterium]|jgi:hypothetical protein
MFFRRFLAMRGSLLFVVALLSGCGSAPPLPFSNVPVTIPAFTSDRPTTTSVMRVGSWIEETVALPSAKLEDVERAVQRLKNEGWRVLQTEMQVNSWQFLLEKEGVQVNFLYHAGRGATVIARRRAEGKD